MKLPSSRCKALAFTMTTTVAPGVATSNQLETSIGPLNPNDGIPTAATIENIYDNLNHSQELQTNLLTIPIVNQAGMRDSLRRFGPVDRTNVIWENLVVFKTVDLTANDNAIWWFIRLDTRKRPLVVEALP